MKNITNPTPSQVKYRNKLWAEALKENKRKARKGMRDKSGGLCCLAVAQKVAIFNSLKVDNPTQTDGFPPKMVADFFGWDSIEPKLNLPNEETASASFINDSIEYKGKMEGLPHKLIAECVLNTFVRPKGKKWTF